MDDNESPEEMSEAIVSQEEERENVEKNKRKIEEEIVSQIVEIKKIKLEESGNKILEDCINKLFDMDVVKFGDFELKSGMKSPVYFDLRSIISQPKIMETVATLMQEKSNVPCTQICGVPYTALPLATIISLKKNIAMLIKRKEAKKYGTKKQLEGVFKAGEKCLVLEDVIVSGGSVFEAINVLELEGLEVSEVIVFLDREQGGVTHLKKFNVDVKAVITITELLTILHASKRISAKTLKETLEFVEQNKAKDLIRQSKLNLPLSRANVSRVRMSYEARAANCDHAVAGRILTLMATKRTNLCVAADVYTAKELLELAEEVGPYICMLKTHADMIDDFTKNTFGDLKRLSIRYDFLLFEDRKFCDIGATMLNQLRCGIYAIDMWADLVSAHALPGIGSIEAMACTEDKGSETRGCVLVANMSCEGNLARDDYMKQCIEVGKSVPSFVIGYVSSIPVDCPPHYIQMTPGVHCKDLTDGMAQKYCSAECAVSERGADVIIVGRGVTQSESPSSAAMFYRNEAYKAYIKRINIGK